MHGQFYENTVVVQYDKDLLEVWDEAKRLRCEWFNDYEKTASKPPMVIADLDVIQLDFRGMATLRSRYAIKRHFLTEMNRRHTFVDDAMLSRPSRDTIGSARLPSVAL